MDLNNPDTRQRILGMRLQDGAQLVASQIADEFGVSLDTVRRDILALEASGMATRIRGGAVPIATPAKALHRRLSKKTTVATALITAAIKIIGDAKTVLVDGGTTTLALIPQLPRVDGRLVITPSPWVAIACQEANIDVFLLGGTLSPRGGITTGNDTILQAERIAADIAVLGACGIDPDWGLSADDYAEAQMKQAMHAAAAQTIIVTEGKKIGKRARHQTLPLQDIAVIITDAPKDQTAALSEAGAAVVTV
ncbi:DeoR/GlpR family DNA-binding transcription regulator [Yoonia sp. BS5-3]|uniref:DeoR/GlpR family DNA-binding transcription regulator n=1 Tax=Yoonia phaeophyticola TaxID=3137369 RepID=A0ABZ2V5C3_9RHOB